MRARYRLFIREFMREFNASPDPTDHEAVCQRVADRMGWLNGASMPMDPKKALRRVKGYLANLEIAEGIRDAFEISGFSVLDAQNKLVDWINGNVEYERTHILKDGTVMTVKEKMPPNLDALRQYIAIALPKQTKKVNIHQETLVARVNVGDAAPAIRARVIDTPALEAVESGMEGS